MYEKRKKKKKKKHRKKKRRTHVHPKTRNSATESALLAKGSLDFEFAYRNPYFTHVSRTSL